jgi:hypothetical protein
MMSVAFYELKDTSKMSQEEITKSGLQPVMTQTEMEVNDETFGVGRRIKDCGVGNGGITENGSGMFPFA